LTVLFSIPVIAYNNSMSSDIPFRQILETLFDPYLVSDADVDLSVKEVYAHFGLAYYESEVLHRGLCHLYVFSRFSSRNDVTGPRLDELFAYAYASTLGGIFSELEGSLPVHFREQIREAIKKRNFLAHHFWFERANRFLNSAGRQEMIAELVGLRNLFSQLDKATSDVCEEKLREFGITEEELKKAATEEICDGKPLAFPKNARKLKKEEILTHVWLVNIKSGGKGLVFELNDGTLWQLCDIGLGWTYLCKGHDWVEYSETSRYLPAKIVPRPKMSSAWFVAKRGV